MKRASPTTYVAPRRLFLVRHGKAAPKDIGLSDFERLLTEKGADDCDRVAAKLRQTNLSVDLMLSSPADRALETAHLFARRLGYPFQKIQIADVLYATDSVAPVLSLLKRLPDSARNVMVFGHNPLLDELAAYLIRSYSHSMGKGAVTVVAFDAASWISLKKGGGQLQSVISPPGHVDPAARVPGRRVS